MQFDLIDAASRRDTGIRHASEHAEQCSTGWNERALYLLKSFASRQTEPFLAEAFVAHCEGLIEPPPDGRAWGSVFRSAAQKGVIVRAGFAPAATSNCSIKPTWRRA